jgi:hypothetical protein
MSTPINYQLIRNWPDPDPQMRASPEFEAIWQCIKTWDINVPNAYDGYCGAEGNRVRAILEALAEVKRDQLAEADRLRPLAVEALNELQSLRKQIVHGGAWTQKIDDLFIRARKAGL